MLIQRSPRTLATTSCTDKLSPVPEGGEVTHCIHHLRPRIASDTSRSRDENTFFRNNLSVRVCFAGFYVDNAWFGDQ